MVTKPEALPAVPPAKEPAMRRSWTVLVITAVILSLATVAVVPIASAIPATQPDIATAPTFTVLANATNFQMINVDGHDIGPGDYMVERWALRRAGAPVGRLNDQCTINFNQTPSNPTALCVFAFTFSREGEIVGDGSVVFAPAPEGFRPTPFDLPVTGGTGSYQNVRGQIHVEFLDAASASFTFDLIP
jgi:hypothetical protein